MHVTVTLWLPLVSGSLAQSIAVAPSRNVSCPDGAGAPVLDVTVADKVTVWLVTAAFGTAESDVLLPYAVWVSDADPCCAGTTEVSLAVIVDALIVVELVMVAMYLPGLGPGTVLPTVSPGSFEVNWTV